MTRLNITNSLISELIAQTAPLVTSLTGWDLQLSGLVSTVVPKELGYETIVEERLAALGIPVSQLRSFAERAIEYLVENNVLAAYEPLTNKLVVLSENVDDSNMDGLRVILGHELVHRGQHVQYPEIFERVNAALRAAIAESEREQPDLGKITACFQEVQPLMTMIESHAAYIQGLLLRRHFPHAQIERHFGLPVLMFRVLGFGKTMQYTDGLPQVAQAMQQGGMDALFGRLSAR